MPPLRDVIEQPAHMCRYAWPVTIVAMKQLPFPVSTERLTIRFFEDRDRGLEVAIHDDRELFTHLPIDPRTTAEIDESLKKRIGQHALDEVGGTVLLAVERPGRAAEAADKLDQLISDGMTQNGDVVGIR
jgi:hypothetical protein